MTSFLFGLVLGIAIATGLAVYHAWIMFHISNALHELEAKAEGEFAQAVMFARKKIGL